MYNINLLITTFNRPVMLGNLLEQIVQEKPSNTVIHIHNDGSTANYIPVINRYKSQLEIRYFSHSHHGKKRYWDLINKVFKSRAKAKYYIMLPDDDILVPNFFNKVINKWKGIKDPRKVCMMPSINEERKWKNSWTGVIPKKVGEVWESGFVDMRFISGVHFFDASWLPLEPVDPSVWKENPLASSGVGKQISLRFHSQNLKMYISEEDLTYQVPHKSFMNPNITDRAI